MSDGVWYGQSQNYSLLMSYETVLLERPEVSEPLVIGYFYGNMDDAVIDPEERWCVMVGRGVIVYRLGPPWDPYTGSGLPSPEIPDRYSIFRSSEDVAQWWECASGASPYLRFSTVEYVDGNDRTEGEGPTRFEILAESGILRPLTQE
jgi:hypothetical protein